MYCSGGRGESRQVRPGSRDDIWIHVVLSMLISADQGSYRHLTQVLSSTGFLPQCRRPRFDSWVGKIHWRDGYPLHYSWAALVAQLVKNLPTMWETWVPPLGWEGPWEKGTVFWPGESRGLYSPWVLSSTANHKTLSGWWLSYLSRAFQTVLWMGCHVSAQKMIRGDGQQSDGPFVSCWSLPLILGNLSS